MNELKKRETFSPRLSSFRCSLFHWKYPDINKVRHWLSWIGYESWNIRNSNERNIWKALDRLLFCKFVSEEMHQRENAPFIEVSYLSFEKSTNLLKQRKYCVLFHKEWKRFQWLKWFSAHKYLGFYIIFSCTSKYLIYLSTIVSIFLKLHRQYLQKNLQF